jgi:cyclic-di-GMP phosphodiesterase TipF (flagellum assembly factor)
MSLITHVVYALAYVITGVTVAVALPHIRPDMDPLVAGLTGAVIILAAALAHEIATRMEHERLFTRLRAGMGALASQLERQKTESAHLNAALEEAARRVQGQAPGHGQGAHTYETVMQEVKILQSLVSRLHDKRPDTAAAAGETPARATPDTAPRPPQAVRARLESGMAALAQPQAPQIHAPTTVLDDAAVLEAVRDALKADRIDIYLQPIVSLPQRKHRFYEVYSRVRGADGSQIMPDRYLAIAEREGLISTIDNMLLIRCLQLIRETERRQHHIGFFSNISAATLGDADFMRQFLHYIAQNQALVPKLVFELSQHDLRQGGATVMGILSQLARLGFRFSMDQVTDLDIDVEALVRHEFRYIKLECGRLLAPEAHTRIEALRRKLQGEAIDLIAEKIETENQLIEALDFDIDFGEGYLFGEPRLSRKPS